MEPSDGTSAFSFETFAGREGESFRIEFDDGVAVNLDLAEVKAWGEPPDGEARQPFNLLFAGPMEPILPQRIYRFVDTHGGSFDIFIVPVGPASGRMQYEAVFN